MEVHNTSLQLLIRLNGCVCLSSFTIRQSGRIPSRIVIVEFKNNILFLYFFGFYFEVGLI